ncbi:MAG TPA: DUF6580 family putative transport protein [Flavisolibacter sp.]|nr:DUF6580 family putative transport protein [Flavisolibacter sp.]
MKLNKSVLLAFGLLVLSASLYRAWGDRPEGFAPQLAMAIFGGAMIRDKRLAFILPLLSMLISDSIYQLLYTNGLFDRPGFYKAQGFFDSQLLNYVLFALLTVFGFLLKKPTALRVFGFGLSGSVLYFLASNLLVWMGGGGFGRPKTFEGLMQCYGDALAFYREYGLIEGFAGNAVVGDLFFCALLFGSFALLSRFFMPAARQQAA